MARYTGPKNRIARSFGVNIFSRARNPLLHKQNPPGQHGARHRKKSDFGIQLEEKQKLRAVYGMISQKQLVRSYQKAVNKAGNTPDNLIAMLECRLDNLVYRMKLAPSIFAAQQLVAHGHVLVNGKKVDIRSYQVVPGQTVSVTEASHKIPIIQKAQESNREIPSYITEIEGKFAAQLTSLPSFDQVPFPVEINLPMICDFLAHTN
ncbi:MAG: 30S ribosomal protein S4 [Chlamydiota bacterium]